MPDSPDVYTDQFQIHLSPYGVTLNFMVSPAVPPAMGAAPQPERAATVRMSLEHLKVMTFLLFRNMREYERQTGTHVEVPQEVLNSLRIGREDWDGLWQ